MKTRKNFRLPNDLITEAQIRAKERGLTLTKFVEDAITHYLNQSSYNDDLQECNNDKHSSAKETTQTLRDYPRTRIVEDDSLPLKDSEPLIIELR
jgi:predicted DNA binding CopG/RHH family protein